MIDSSDEDLALARRRAGSRDNLRSVNALQAAVVGQRDRWWTIALVVLPLAAVLLPLVCVRVDASAVPVVVAVTGLVLAVVGLVVAAAVRVRPARDNPLFALGRADRRRVSRMATGRASVDPTLADIVAAVAAITYRQRWLALPWGGLAVFWTAQVALADDLVARCLYATASTMIAAGAWMAALQAVRVIRVARRRPPVSTTGPGPRGR